ncbi:MAG TPA: ATP-binding cassette domain-containing protein [Myxococcota bacterium]|nr:ATP-binding cassette domain-containing protein [Myxococcota bacterium]
MPSLLELRGLTIAIPERNLVTGVDIDVRAGRITALMGPSGSGKTLSARAAMGFIDVDPGLKEGTLRYPQLSGDKDWFEGVRGGGPRAQDKLLRETRQLRGAFVAYAPQAASSALNPARTVGRQLELAIGRREQPPTSSAELAAAVRECLDDVGLPYSASAALAGELSGGMAQRTALAIAVAPLPKVLIADEPETGLDPVLTRQIIELMIRVAQSKKCGMLLISHHEETVERVADDVVRLPPGGQA